MIYIIKIILKIIRLFTVTPLLLLYGINHGIEKKPYIESLDQYIELVQCLFFQKILLFNYHVPWPVSPMSKVGNPKNIHFDKKYVRNFTAKGCYWQANSKIIFKGSFLVAQNVAFISENHNIYNIARHTKPDNPIIIGDNCLFSYNSVILPGVELGENTIVAANSVVNKSFPEGNCILAEVPARVVKKLDPDSIHKCTADNFWESK